MKTKHILLILIIVGVLCINVSAFALGFVDVNYDAWYGDSVEYVVSKGIMNGVSTANFAPEKTVTREMLVTILYRMDGDTSEIVNCSFEDVGADDYSYSAIKWASANNIVNGYNPAKFAPREPITREQFAAVLYRYYKLNELDTSARADLSNFTDAGSISAYALEAMQWANAMGFISGLGGSVIDPKGGATRAQTAVIITRVMESLNDLKNDSEISSGDIVPDAPDYTPTKSATLTAGNITANAGEKRVEVPVYIENNPGILGMILTVQYDSSCLTLVDSKNGSAFENTLAMTKPGKYMSPCNFVWDGVEIAAEDVRDGTALVLIFDVSENASGIIPVNIACAEGSVIGNDLNTLGISAINGLVTVSK